MHLPGAKIATPDMEFMWGTYGPDSVLTVVVTVPPSGIVLNVQNIQHGERLLEKSRVDVPLLPRALRLAGTRESQTLIARRTRRRM